MNTSDISPDTARTDDKRKRRPIVAGLLAVLAVGGIGAAATSAAWTDNVFFSAGVASATFDLTGSTDGKTWQASSTDDMIEFAVDPANFANLLPGETRTVSLHLKNEGSVGATLVAAAPVIKGFDEGVTDPSLKLTAKITDFETTLSAGSESEFTLTVTAPENWPELNKGKSGTVVVEIQGTATAP